MGEWAFQARDLKELSAAAESFLARYPKGAVVGLSGDLGAGKTAFVRQLIAALARRKGLAEPKVTSPSFVIHQSYASLNPPVEHFDLYRLDNAGDAELIELGYGETVDSCRASGGYVFVEWPERAVAKSLTLDLLVTIRILPTGARELRSTVAS